MVFWYMEINGIIVNIYTLSVGYYDINFCCPRFFCMNIICLIGAYVLSVAVLIFCSIYFHLYFVVDPKK